ncbi:hypothetical protein DMA11_05715 [Marinilabiliaceae bacterium JC017]|nr:hypothetical protein DMA11_05715 [Marinilabiliaceae bacterium JC017]
MKKQFLSLIIVSAIFSCTNTKKQAAIEQKQEMERFYEKVKEIHPEISKVGDVSTLLYMAGVDFMPELVNDHDNWELYKEDELLAAANMGLYLADGLYQVIFEKSKDAYMSIMAAKQLAQELGIAAVFDEIMVKRYEEGSTPDASVLKKFSEALYLSSKSFNEQERMQVFGAALIGNYVEKLFILFHNIFDGRNDISDETKLQVLRKVIVVTGEELDLLPGLINFVENYKDEQGDGYLLSDLRELDELRQSLDFEVEEYGLTADMIFKNNTLIEMKGKIIQLRALLATGGKRG